MANSNRFIACALCLLAMAVLIVPGGRAAEADLGALALELVNADRKSAGLSPLQTDAALCQAAQAHADDMLTRDYFDHLSPEGEDVMDRYAASGGNRWLGVAENIFKCIGCPDRPDPSIVRTMHRQWMASEEHRGTILSSRHSGFCFGIAADPEKGYAAVQTFAGTGKPRQSGLGRAPRVLAPEQLRGFALALINDQRRREGRDALRASDSLSEDAEAFLRAELARDPDGTGSLSTEKVREFLSGHDRGAWWKVGVLLEACGGCGTEVTDGDAAYFAESWARHESFRSTLLGSEFDSFGLALVADGKGRKIALGLFGDRGQ